MATFPEGLSVEWLTGATRLLLRLHGNRMMAPDDAVEEFWKGLYQAEQSLIKMKLAPPKKSRKKVPPCPNP